MAQQPASSLINGAHSSNNSSSASDNVNDRLDICATSLKLPSFWLDYPEAWFIHAETLFENKGIIRDNTKYEYLIVSLPQDVIMSVIDIVQNPPQEDRYATLKSKLLERHTLSEQKKLDKLLSNSEMGDRKPSEFYRSLVLLSGPNMNTEFVKKLWLRKLPRTLNISLVGSNIDNIEDLLKLADSIWEIASGNDVCTVSSYGNENSHSDVARVVDNLMKLTSAMCDQFNKLSLEITEVRRSLESFNSERRFKNRSRSRGRSASRKWLCRFHYRFGSKARSCEQPCSYDLRSQGN